MRDNPIREPHGTLPPMTAAFYTLGCKVNQYETQAMERLWTDRGHSVVPFHDPADAYVINTCSVTGESDRKSKQMIRRVRREHPDAVVAVCGCFAQTHPEEAAALDADLTAGSGDRAAFVSLLEQAVESRRAGEHPIPDRSLLSCHPFTRRSFEMLPAGRLRGRTRAMLKVEDGCANFCAYCIIPYARGPVRSEPMEDAVRQARDLAAEGVREIVITGIEISSWGREFRTGETLIDLTEALCRAVPAVRIRLGSLEPRTVTEDFARRAAALANLCPQFHLSLQSGCDETLRRMNRRYDTARFWESVTLLRRFFPHGAITTDLIVGFPGETEAEFQETLDFLDRCGFAKVHVFPYSPRPGTPASEMGGQVPKAVKEERVRQASAAADRSRRAYLRECVGEVFPVLFEQVKDGGFFGHAPNYMGVLVHGEGLRGEIRPVRILSAGDDVLYGEIVEGGI